MSDTFIWLLGHAKKLLHMDGGVLVPDGEVLHLAQHLDLGQGEVGTACGSRQAGGELRGAASIELSCNCLTSAVVSIVMLGLGNFSGFRELL